MPKTTHAPNPAPSLENRTHPTSRAVEDAFDALRAIRWNLLSENFEERVAAFYRVEDITAELSAWVASVDPREL